MARGELVISYPRLPLLASSMETLIARALKEVETEAEVVFEVDPWLEKARITYENREDLEQSFSAVMSEGLDRLTDLRTAPVTFGVSGDTAKYGKICEKLSIPPVTGKLYERTKRICESYLEKREGKLLDVLSQGWDVEVKGKKARIVSGDGAYKLPAVIRSVSLYESGRFFGFREERSGSVARGALDVRSGDDWWLLSLISVVSSMVTIERVERETRIIHLFFRPEYGVTYSPRDMEAYVEVLDGAADTIRRAGLYVEDTELTRLTLLLHCYSRVENPLLYARKPAAVKIDVIRALGRRFSEAFSETLPLDEIVVVHRALRERYGEDSFKAAGDYAKLGYYLILLLKRYQALSSELRLDRLATLYKLALRGVIEPGFTAPLELLYELRRTITNPDYKARFIGVLAARIKSTESLGDKEAKSRARALLDRIVGLVGEVAESVPWAVG